MTEESKNLTTVETRQEKPMREGTAQTADVKGKIVGFLWWLKKQGRSKPTINSYGSALNVISRKGADLLDPESVKEALARESFSDTFKRLIIAAYTAFLKLQGGTWEPPVCYVPRKLPFIPLEREIDDLIAGCGKKTATFLQLLKETGMRAGEALRLKWTDIDFQRKVVILNEPEKHGNPRVFNVSPKLVNMLNALPRKRERIFGSYDSVKSSFIQSKKRLSAKLDNPRLLTIKFHTFRHWKATMLYHQTKDILYVKEFLGHRRIENTMLYIQIAETIFKGEADEFTVKVASKPEEIKALLEVGFDWIGEKQGIVYFRKRK